MYLLGPQPSCPNPECAGKLGEEGNSKAPTQHPASKRAGVCLCFLLNLCLETWLEISESKIKNTKLTSLKRGAAVGALTVVGGIIVFSLVGKLEVDSISPLTFPSLFPARPAGSSARKFLNVK